MLLLTSTFKFFLVISLFYIGKVHILYVLHFTCLFGFKMDFVPILNPLPHFFVLISYVADFIHSSSLNFVCFRWVFLFVCFFCFQKDIAAVYPLRSFMTFMATLYLQDKVVFARHLILTSAVSMHSSVVSLH